MADERNFAFLHIVFTLIFGTATVVTQKLLFSTKSKGRYEEHDFEKPIFQTNAMFFGMFLALIPSGIQHFFCKKEEEDFFSNRSNVKKNSILYIFLAAIPTIFDLVATTLMNVQLLYIKASVWQMLRGSMTVFTSLLSYFVLKKATYPYMWFGVFLNVLSLFIVGIASVFNTGISNGSVSRGRVILAMFLTVLAQLIQASQLVIEEYLMQGSNLSPLFLVGMKGVWGTLLGIIFLFVAHHIHGDKDNGIHEDFKDTIAMLKNSSTIVILVVLYILFILLYNVFGMYVTSHYSSVVRTIVEGIRTLFIWVVQLILYYTTKNDSIGESWCVWNWLQLSGFCLLFISSLIYSGVIKLHFFHYPSEEISIIREISSRMLYD